MTNLQFTTFLQQLDASLKQISTEIFQEQMDLSTQLFMKAILMKLRVVFGTIGKQILSQEPQGRRSLSEAELRMTDCLRNAVEWNDEYKRINHLASGDPYWVPYARTLIKEIPQPMAPADSSSAGSGVPAQLGVHGADVVIRSTSEARRGCDEQPTAPLLDKRAGVGEFIAPVHVENELTPTDLYYQNEEWLREAFSA